MEDFKVYKKKGQYYKLLVTSVFMLIMFILPFVRIFQQDHSTYKLIKLIGLGFLICFAVVFLVLALKEILVKKPALQLTKEGIIDQLSTVSMASLPWNKIKRTEIVSYRGSAHLAIFLKPFDWKAFAASSFNVKMGKTIDKDLGTPLVFNQKLIELPIEELKKEIDQRLRM